MRSRRTVRIRQERQLQPIDRLRKRIAQRPIGIEVHDVVVRALNLRERAVEDVARVGEAHDVARIDKRPREHREQLVAAVAAEDPIGIEAVERPGLHAKRGRQRVGILLQPGLHDPPDRRLHLRRAGIRILIRVELDDLLTARLLARHVAGHRGDVGTEVRTCGGRGQDTGVRIQGITEFSRVACDVDGRLMHPHDSAASARSPRGP